MSSENNGNHLRKLAKIRGISIYPLACPWSGLKSMFATQIYVIFTVCNNDNKEMSTSENVNPFDILTCFNFHCVFAETFIIITLLGSNVCCTPFQIECCSSSWKCHTCTANTNLLIKFFSNFISKWKLIERNCSIVQSEV